MRLTALALWLAAAPAGAQNARPNSAPAQPRKTCAIPLLNLKPPQGRAVRPDPMVLTPPAVPPDRNSVIVPAPPCGVENRPKDANPKKPEDGAGMVHQAAGNQLQPDWFCIRTPCAGRPPAVSPPRR